MGPRRDVRFVSSGIKLPRASPAHALLSAALPFAHIGRAIDAAACHVAASFPRLPVARAETAAAPLPRRLGKDGGEERVLISEVAVRGKDGEPLERPELEEAAAAALRACRPNAALTVREVQEDVHRVVESGLFHSCMTVAVDTRDGIRLVFKMEPNQDFQGLVCEGANMLPSKFLQATPTPCISTRRTFKRPQPRPRRPASSTTANGRTTSSMTAAGRDLWPRRGTCQGRAHQAVAATRASGGAAISFN